VDNIIAGKRKFKKLLKETIQARRQPEIKLPHKTDLSFMAITSQWIRQTGLILFLTKSHWT
jgi:hypothetical protein